MVLKVNAQLPLPTRPAHFRILEKLSEFEQNFPEDIALVNGDNHEEKWNFRQVRKSIHSIATFLHNNGFHKGEVCGLIMPNRCEFPMTVLGVWCSGMTTSAMSSEYTLYELLNNLRSSEAVVVVTEEGMVDKILAVAHECPKLRMIISMKTSSECAFRSSLDIQNNNTVKVEKGPAVVSFDDVMETTPSFDPHSIEFDLKEDIASIPFSSGTTGLPKPALISHWNYASVLGIFEYTQQTMNTQNITNHIKNRGKYLMTVPNYHAMAFYASLVSLHRGCESYYFRKFHFPTFLQHIEQLKVTAVHLHPYIAQQLTEDPIVDQFDMSSLKLVMCGGAPLGSNVIEKLRSKFSVAIQQAYGMTELTLSISSHIRTDYPVHSVGSVLPGLELKFVNTETGLECGPNEQGELRVRGPIVMKGYKDRPQETKEAFDDDGFLKTGDLAYFDENEFIFMCERTKEMFKVNTTYSVAPSEIENVILGIPGILDCAVIGVPHPRLHTAPRAYVVRNGEKITEETINEHVNDRVSEHKQLAGGIEFLDSIPRLPTGKVLRRQLRERFEKANQLN